MNEKWVTVPGAGNYEVSSLGRVRRRAATYGCSSGRLLKLRLDVHGYVKVSLSLGRKREYRYAQVHRLVAEAFLGPAPWSGAQVAHYDGVRTNNALSNLRWASPGENAADRRRHGRAVGAHRGEDHHMAKLDASAVVQIRSLKAEGWRLEEIADAFGVGRTTIYEALTGKTWGHLNAGV